MSRSFGWHAKSSKTSGLLVDREASDSDLAGDGLQEAVSEELLRRLCAHDAAEGLFRLVSKAASVHARACDYTAYELQDLIGQEVSVFVDRFDPRFAYVDHPKTGTRVVCKAVTSPVAYARDAAEANQISHW